MTTADLTIYGNLMSGNCLKVKWTAERLGVAFRWVEMDILAGAVRTADFLGLNPTGKIPFARWSDGRGLPESNAIMFYLTETAGPNTLIPAEPYPRGQMMSWMFWEQYSHEPAIAVRRFQKKFLEMPDAQIDPALMEKGNGALALMEKQLTYTDYLVGKGLTLADIALLAYTRVAPEGGFDLGQFPAVSDWVARCETELGV